jgi:hypothetical protein
MSTITDVLSRARQAVGDAEAARQREREALAVAKAAKRARQEAEHRIPAAKREAALAEEELRREAEHRLAALRAQLQDAQQLAASHARVRPSVQLRLGARVYLYGGPEGGSDALLGLAQRDAPLGALLDAGRACGQFLTWCFDSAVDAAFAAEGDDLEVLAWSAAMARCRQLAGEDVQR